MFTSKDSDSHWERFGEQDPYFGVLSSEEFKSNRLDDATREIFFVSGEEHVDHVFTTIKTHITPDFHASKALDFGCGVGRIIIPLAKRCDEAVGVDVSIAMLEEALKSSFSGLM